MSVLVTADLHFSDNPRDAYRHTFMEKLPKLVKEHKTSALFVLGDLCEEKDFHSATLVNKVVDHFHQLSQVVPVIIDMGNHDYTADPNNPFFRFLSRMDNVTWVDRPLSGQLYDIERYIILPHTRNWQQDWEKIDFTHYDWVFAHQTFAGADTGSGKKLSGISPEIFKGTRVISGDIHHPQTYGLITYVGSPYTVDFGDDFEPRILHLRGLKMTSIPVGGAQKRLVEITSLKDLDKAKNLGKGDILKIRVALKADQRDEWPTLQKAIRKWCEDNDFVCNAVQPTNIATDKLRNQAEARAPRSDEELLAEYAKRHGVDDRTLKVGLDLLRAK